MFRNSEDPVHFWPASAGTHRSGEATTVPLVRHRLTTGLCSRQQTTQHSQTRAAPEPRGCSCGVASNDKSALQLLLPFPRASTNSSSCPVTLSPSGLCVGPSAFSPISAKWAALSPEPPTCVASFPAPTGPQPHAQLCRLRRPHQVAPASLGGCGKHHGMLGPSTSL